jgi:hypothetical protein
MDGLMTSGIDTSPLGIVTQRKTDRNIPELDCCGETVGIPGCTVGGVGKCG